MRMVVLSKAINDFAYVVYRFECVGRMEWIDLARANVQQRRISKVIDKAAG